VFEVFGSFWLFFGQSDSISGCQRVESFPRVWRTLCPFVLLICGVSVNSPIRFADTESVEACVHSSSSIFLLRTSYKKSKKQGVLELNQFVGFL